MDIKDVKVGMEVYKSRSFNCCTVLRGPGSSMRMGTRGVVSDIYDRDNVDVVFDTFPFSQVWRVKASMIESDEDQLPQVRY